MGQWFPFRRSSQKALGSKVIMNRRGWTFGSFSCDLFDLLTDLLFDLIFVVKVVRHGGVGVGRHEVRVLSM
jgi:hypothetical protein